jgi:hypothetical protein
MLCLCMFTGMSVMTIVEWLEVRYKLQKNLGIPQPIY